MIRRTLAAVVLGVFALAPASFAQSDLEGLPTTGIENPKEEATEVLLRLGFTFASSVVPETVRLRLDRVAGVLAGERASEKIEVAGHTDAVGNPDYNQQLSEQRAAAVKDYLVAHGVDAGRISVVGYGEARPRSPNETIEGRRLNRRVEIRVKS